GRGGGAMAALPTGTVTFLFTDLEGSTRLWQGHPDVMKSALARHDELIRAAVELRGGVVVKTTGDGVHAAFATAEDGVLAAADAQRSLVAVPWPETGPPRVRMGEPEAALSAARRAWEQAVVVGARTSFGQSLGIAFLTLADLKRW